MIGKPEIPDNSTVSVTDVLLSTPDELADENSIVGAVSSSEIVIVYVVLSPKLTLLGFCSTIISVSAFSSMESLTTETLKD